MMDDDGDAKGDDDDDDVYLHMKASVKVQWKY